MSGYAIGNSGATPKVSVNTINKKYDASTGILNVSGGTYVVTGITNAWFCSSSLTFKVYLVA